MLVARDSLLLLLLLLLISYGELLEEQYASLPPKYKAVSSCSIILLCSTLSVIALLGVPLPWYYFNYDIEEGLRLMLLLVLTQLVTGYVRLRGLGNAI